MKRPGTVFNTSNILYHSICFSLVLVVLFLQIYDLTFRSDGTIKRTKVGASWFFRSQISFEIIYFVSTMFLIKIFNEIVDKCVDSLNLNEDFDDRAIDLLVEGSFLTEDTHKSLHQSSKGTQAKQPRLS